MGFRERVGIVWIGIALCVPSGTLSQTIAAALATAPAAPASPAVPIETNKGLDGRLFFSALERQRLDAARRRGLVLSSTGELPDSQPSVLNGFVKRSDGKTAVWVDGEGRWDALGKNAAALMPTIVGGPAIYLKSTSGETQAASVRPSVHAKKVVKARARKNTLPRLAP